MKILDTFRPVPFVFLNTTDSQAYTQSAVDKALLRCRQGSTRFTLKIWPSPGNRMERFALPGLQAPPSSP